MLRSVCLISGGSHVVTAWELGRGGLIRLAAYDPRTSMTYEAQLSTIERACLGYNGEDCKVWTKDLCRRLSLRKATAEPPDAAEGGKRCPRRNILVLDKTVFSTACRIAAGAFDARLLRIRASLVDAGRCLALDIYENDTSRQCRILLTTDDLVGAGLQPHVQDLCKSDPTTALGLDLETAESDDADAQRAGREMACMLTGTESKATTVRHLVRQLRFVPDSDSVTFTANGSARTAKMTVSQDSHQRRPQISLRAFVSLQTAAKPAPLQEVHAATFLKRHRQPAVLVYGVQLSPPCLPDQAGKKKAPDSATRCSTHVHILLRPPPRTVNTYKCRLR